MEAQKIQAYKRRRPNVSVKHHVVEGLALKFFHDFTSVLATVRSHLKRDLSCNR